MASNTATWQNGPKFAQFCCKEPQRTPRMGHILGYGDSEGTQSTRNYHASE